MIVDARQAAGLSQRALAAKLKRSGSFVWKMESQEHRVDVLEFIEIVLWAPLSMGAGDSRPLIIHRAGNHGQR